MQWLKILSFSLLIFFSLTALLWLQRKGDERLAQAEKFYQKGEAAETIAAGKEGFNSALNLFLALEGEHRPYFGTGKLEYNIGNTYYQLGEFPLAIAYYRRAENLMPRSQSVKENLQQARSRAGLSGETQTDLFDVLLFKPFISLPEKIQVFFTLSFLGLIFIVSWMWLKRSWLGKIAAVFLIPAVVVLLNLVLSYYFSPIEAVLVHAVELRRNAGMDYPKVSEQPIPGGTEVEVVGYSSDSNWFRVVAPNNDFGYVPAKAIKLIR